MRQLGCIKIADTMAKQGISRFSYFTCPICEMAMGSHCKGIIGHLVTHVKQGVIPKHHVGYIGLLIENRKGVNAKIAKLDTEVREYVTHFVGLMRSASYQRVDPIGDRARCKQ